jgi:hypothetical protein
LSAKNGNWHFSGHYNHCRKYHSLNGVSPAMTRGLNTEILTARQMPEKFVA